ncbi:hypothetical protein CEXT_734461 [Caerostris extrusa]|uniref:Uncharacterized protein n=1 Tax=Caerostris extrusa TaxID=172846 RepID=A0AAV4X2J8_CAEEX|nr:hypothetical protein CEXT_734461 [Caerostris extrusa]
MSIDNAGKLFVTKYSNKTQKRGSISAFIPSVHQENIFDFKSSQPQGNTKQNIGDKERDKAELKYPNLVIFCVDRNQIKDSSIDISPHALIPAFLLKALLASKEAYLYQRC